jgi:EAL domain-containing protein (putative c-di-GMP-specific phosphodiesterase class I)
LEADLRTALQENQFEIYYQPKIRLETGYVKGVEALVRWRHPRRGTISPQDFIPVAEEMGLISEIGRWVAVQAIRQLAAWRSAGVVDQNATMAINVSAQVRTTILRDGFTRVLHERTSSCWRAL